MGQSQATQTDKSYGYRSIDIQSEDKSKRMIQAILDQLKPDAIIRSSLFPEPVKLITTMSMGDSIKLIGTGLETNQTYQPVLTLEELVNLIVSPTEQPFDGDANRFRLGVEALRLGLAYEYDPYFALSIARIDPLPHQLEAVYDYFIKTPRIRFLLADDPGAGKTIMAGLLMQELKARGLIQRILIITPAILLFNGSGNSRTNSANHLRC